MKLLLICALAVMFSGCEPLPLSTISCPSPCTFDGIAAELKADGIDAHFYVYTWSSTIRIDHKLGVSEYNGIRPGHEAAVLHRAVLRDLPWSQYAKRVEAKK